MEYKQIDILMNQRSIPRIRDHTADLKIPQHENYDILEVREYFCTKFCSVV